MAKSQTIYPLSEMEWQIILKGRQGDFNYVTGYFFRMAGMEVGFQFDENIEPPWQLEAVLASQKTMVISGGAGCFDIDTKIYDAELKKYISARELIENNRRPVVLSKSATGWNKIKASEIYRKSTEAMFEITLSSGKSIVVTADHIFLTNQGYLHTRDLLPGVSLVAPDMPSSIAGNDALDALSDLEKEQDCQSNYSLDCHQCDEPLLQKEDIFQVSVPLHSDALLSSHSISSFHHNLLGQVSQRIQQHDAYHSRRLHCPRQNDECRTLSEDRLCEATDEPVHPLREGKAPLRSSDNSSQYWKDVLGSDYIDLKPFRVSHLHQEDSEWQYQAADICGLRDMALFHDELQPPLTNQVRLSLFEYFPELSNPGLFSSFVPPNDKSSIWWNYTTLDTIVSIESVGDREVYDLHVPLSNNYVAEGVVNHNCGKTGVIGMGGSVFSLIVPYFKFLNASQKEFQALQMRDFIMERTGGAPVEQMITERHKPNEKLTFQYKNPAGQLHQATMEFMSADKTAKGILSWRGDWINVDEAGLFDNLDEITTHLATRLTGAAPNKRPYMGRYSLISNPWDSSYFWYLFDMASSDPVNAVSMIVSTRWNKNVTEDQLSQVLARIQSDERERFIEGTRPEGKGNYFAKNDIAACEDPVAGELAKLGFKDGKTGYAWDEMAGIGCYRYAIPKQDGRIYFVLGDPGSGAAPARNAPVVMVWDVTEFPESPATLVYFWWGNGWGAITPFVQHLLDAGGLSDSGTGYSAAFVGIDSTGPQTALATMLNIQYLSVDGNSDTGRRINGMDFSGTKKMAYLVSLRLFVEAHLMRWPKAISGIRSQLGNYEPERDRGPMPKLPQDIVATMAMTAFILRKYFNLSTEELYGQANRGNSDLDEEEDFVRLSQTERSRRSDTRP